MADLSLFFQAIDADPADTGAVLTLADRLEELGLEHAVGLRWLAENGFEPVYHVAPWGWDFTLKMLPPALSNALDARRNKHAYWAREHAPWPKAAERPSEILMWAATALVEDPKCRDELLGLQIIVGHRLPDLLPLS